MQKEKVPRNSWPILIRSCFPWTNDLKIIEMKKFFDDGMFLPMKITLNTSTTRTNGGSIPISRVLTPYHWEKRSDFKQVLSTLERLQQEAGREQFAPTPYWKNKQWKSASSSSSTLWEHCQKVKERQAKSGEWTVRPVVNRILDKTSDVRLSRFFYFVTDRAFTADSGLL